ncbi:MAG TPA: hypothetical protein VLT33_06375, partial [Labilithrix sp.]|nr:hypothetical protein [Labilithrix sp.]
MPQRGGKSGPPDRESAPRGAAGVSPPDRASSRNVDRASARSVAKEAKETKDRPSRVAKDAAAAAAKKRPRDPGVRRETLEAPAPAALREREREASEKASISTAPPSLAAAAAAEAGPPSLNGSVRAWLDANRAPAPGQGREPFRIPAELVALYTDPASLPERPLDSGGLFELVSTVARRALTLGLASREPSFHVFVAASQQLIIEDDIV